MTTTERIEQGNFCERKINTSKDPHYTSITIEELDAMIQEGHDDVLNGRVYTAEEVDARLEELFRHAGV